MRTKTIISEITKEDLVDFLSTAIYGSQIFDVAIPKGSYKGTELEDENDYREDKWAKVLLSGKHIYVFDNYSEEAFYGNKQHKWIEEEQAMRYKVTLDDIKNGLQAALDSDKKYLREYANDWVNGSYDLDLTEAETLLQFIVFGEVIYG